MTVFTKFLQPPYPTVLIFSFFVDFFALFSLFSRYHRKICITMQVSPVHICLTLCAEDYRVPLSSMVAKTMPMVFVFTAISFLYYGLLRFVGL